MQRPHPFEHIEVRGGDRDEVIGLLKLLPDDTFEFTEDFQRGLRGCSENYCGQIGIYARKEPLFGERGVALIVVNEHLFGDSISSDCNPLLRIPEGATEMYITPPRMPPLKKGPFAGVEFDYQGARFFFGYELSPRAYEVICDSTRQRAIELSE